MSLGLLVSFQFLQAQLIAPISTLPQLSSTLQRLIGDLGRLVDLTSTADDPHVRSFQSARTGLEPTLGDDQRLNGRITLKGVSYGFNAIDPPFLQRWISMFPLGHAWLLWEEWIWQDHLDPHARWAVGPVGW